MVFMYLNRILVLCFLTKIAEGQKDMTIDQALGRIREVMGGHHLNEDAIGKVAQDLAGSKKDDIVNEILGIYKTSFMKCSKPTVDQLESIQLPDPSENCIVENSRYSGTDLMGSVVRVLKKSDTKQCQAECARDPECKFFLYFNKQHPQWFKHGVCRLLRVSGDMKMNDVGHVSGPKNCPDSKAQVESLFNRMDIIITPLIDQFCLDQMQIDNSKLIDGLLEMRLLDKCNGYIGSQEDVLKSFLKIALNDKPYDLKILQDKILLNLVDKIMMELVENVKSQCIVSTQRPSMEEVNVEVDGTYKKTPMNEDVKENLLFEDQEALSEVTNEDEDMNDKNEIVMDEPENGKNNMNVGPFKSSEEKALEAAAMDNNEFEILKEGEMLKETNPTDEKSEKKVELEMEEPLSERFHFDYVDFGSDETSIIEQIMEMHGDDIEGKKMKEITEPLYDGKQKVPLKNIEDSEADPIMMKVKHKSQNMEMSATSAVKDDNVEEQHEKNLDHSKKEMVKADETTEKNFIKENSNDPLKQTMDLEEVHDDPMTKTTKVPLMKKPMESLPLFSKVMKSRKHIKPIHFDIPNFERGYADDHIPIMILHAPTTEMPRDPIPVLTSQENEHQDDTSNHAKKEMMEADEITEKNIIDENDRDPLKRAMSLEEVHDVPMTETAKDPLMEKPRESLLLFSTVMKLGQTTKPIDIDIPHFERGNDADSIPSVSLHASTTEMTMDPIPVLASQKNEHRDDTFNHAEKETIEADEIREKNIMKENNNDPLKQAMNLEKVHDDQMTKTMKDPLMKMPMESLALFSTVTKSGNDKDPVPSRIVHGPTTEMTKDPIPVRASLESDHEEARKVSEDQDVTSVQNQGSSSADPATEFIIHETNIENVEQEPVLMAEVEDEPKELENHLIDIRSLEEPTDGLEIKAPEFSFGNQSKIEEERMPRQSESPDPERVVFTTSGSTIPSQATAATPPTPNTYSNQVPDEGENQINDPPIETPLWLLFLKTNGLSTAFLQDGPPVYLEPEIKVADTYIYHKINEGREGKVLWQLYHSHFWNSLRK